MLLIILLTMIILIMYMMMYKSVEGFTEELKTLRESNGLPDKKVNHGLQMNKPYNLKAKSIQFKDMDLSQPLKLNSNMIKMNEDIVINSEQGLYFKDSTDEKTKLSKEELLDLKKNVSKIKYLDDQLCNVISMQNGEVKGCHSSKTTANDVCTSKLWELSIGKNISKQEVCLACCKNVKKSSIFKAFVSLSSDIYQLAYVNLMNNKTYSLIELESTPSASYNATISMYRNNISLDARLSLLNIPLEQQRNTIQTMSSLESIKTFISTNEYVTYIVETKKTTPSSTLVVWGKFLDGIYIPTTIHINSVSANFALLEVLDREY